MPKQQGNVIREPFHLGPAFNGEVLFDEPLSRHTSFRIGGPARYFVTVKNVTALGAALREIDRFELPWTVIGKGTNLLVADEGFDGAVLLLAGEFASWNYDQEHGYVTAGAALALSRLVQEVYHLGLSGLEFAVGTPGSLGGALRMNAGTRTEWLSKRVISVTTYAMGQGLKRYEGSQIAWGYRSSSLPGNEVVVEAQLAVEPSIEMYIHGKMEGAMARRKKTQPLNFPSCGSVFRNPEGQSVGNLIEEAGLKGYRLGGAQISQKHANFIINTGNATAHDVLGLMKLAQDTVREKYGIELQPEVKFLGFA